MLYGLERTFNVASTGIRYVGRCWRIVYDNLSILPLVDVIRHYLYGNEAKVGDKTKKQAQAVNVDPINQIKHRWAFCTAAKRAGLYVDQQEFPGRNDLVLLRICPSGKKWSSEIKGTSANIFFWHAVTNKWHHTMSWNAYDIILLNFYLEITLFLKGLLS